MAGLITQNQIPEDIVYQTNNLSVLEEKNIGIFLSIIVKEFGLPALFKPKNNKIFQTFSDFSVALTGLARVSKEVQQRTKIPKFTSTGKKTAAGEKGRWQRIRTIYNENLAYLENIEDKTVEAACLEEAIENLSVQNKSFIIEVIEPLKSEDHIGACTILHHMRIPGLLNLHHKLERGLNHVKNNHKSIGSLFESMADDFLIYGLIASQRSQVITRVSKCRRRRRHVCVNFSRLG